jgi:hypothetical protein
MTAATLAAAAIAFQSCILALLAFVPFQRERGYAYQSLLLSDERRSPLLQDSRIGLFETELEQPPTNADEDKRTPIENIQSRGSDKQFRSVRSDAPAVLLKSGPGTGKTFALASRIAHLLRKGDCRPEQMVVLSFTNRDAHLLKEKSLEMLSEDRLANGVTMQDVSNRLWSGTIHAFATSIINAHRGRTRRRLRVLSAKEMRTRVDKCLHVLLDDKRYASETEIAKLKRIRVVHRDALDEVRQSRGMLLHQICRCHEIWKEARLIRPPSVAGTRSIDMAGWPSGQPLRDNCLELAVRFGISQAVALLAMYIIPEYQVSVFEEGEGVS